MKKARNQVYLIDESIEPHPLIHVNDLVISLYLQSAINAHALSILNHDPPFILPIVLFYLIHGLYIEIQKVVFRVHPILAN